MQKWGVNPNQLSFNTIMDAYAREGNVNNVVKIFNYMQVRRTRHPPTKAFRLAVVAVAAAFFVYSTKYRSI